MPSIPDTPKSLLARSDSKDPATTCRGVTREKKLCRRALAASPRASPSPAGGGGGSGSGGVVALLPDGGARHEAAAAYFCHDHKDQAGALVNDVNANSNGPHAELLALQGRDSIETLAERLGVIELGGASGGRREAPRRGLEGRAALAPEKPPPPPKWQRIDGRLRSGPQGKAPAGPGPGPPPLQRRPVRRSTGDLHLSFFCCMQPAAPSDEALPPARVHAAPGRPSPLPAPPLPSPGARQSMGPPSPSPGPRPSSPAPPSASPGPRQSLGPPSPSPGPRASSAAPLSPSPGPRPSLGKPSRSPGPRPSPAAPLSPSPSPRLPRRLSPASPPLLATPSTPSASTATAAAAATTTQDYLALLPPDLPPATTATLLAELAKPAAPADVGSGYIYIFWHVPAAAAAAAEPAAARNARELSPDSLLARPARPALATRRTSDVLRVVNAAAATAAADRDYGFNSGGGGGGGDAPARPASVMLKIGRTGDVRQRLKQWTRQCGQPLALLRSYPRSPAAAPTASPRGSPAPASPPSARADRRRRSATPGTPHNDADGSGSTSGDGSRTGGGTAGGGGGGGPLVPRVARVERLIHLELAGRRVLRDCEACGRVHREWFEVEASRAGVAALHAVIARWVAWGYSQGAGAGAGAGAG